MAEPFLAHHTLPLPGCGRYAAPFALPGEYTDISNRTGTWIKQRLSEFFFALIFYPDFKSGAGLLLKMFSHSSTDICPGKMMLRVCKPESAVPRD
jgi:hypothetical protein